MKMIGKQWVIIIGVCSMLFPFTSSAKSKTHSTKLDYEIITRVTNDHLGSSSDTHIFRNSRIENCTDYNLRTGKSKTKCKKRKLSEDDITLIQNALSKISINTLNDTYGTYGEVLGGITVELVLISETISKSITIYDGESESAPQELVNFLKIIWELAA